MLRTTEQGVSCLLDEFERGDRHTDHDRVSATEGVVGVREVMYFLRTVTVFVHIVGGIHIDLRVPEFAGNGDASFSSVFRRCRFPFIARV